MVQKLKAAESLIPIEDIAAAWGVDPKTIKNWCEFVYQAFEIMLPSAGPFPEWGAQLLNLTAKHVSEKANLYFSETGEKRRLKGSEFVRKVRGMRSEGHFQEFQKFQKFQKFQTFHPDGNPEELEDETLGELGAITRRDDNAISRIKETIEQREDEEIADLAEFIEDGDRRKMGKLIRRLKTGKPATASISQAINVAYTRLPVDSQPIRSLPET